jgi:hypothetical protein
MIDRDVSDRVTTSIPRAFDAARARYRVKMVPLAAERIVGYRDVMVRGGLFPPVSVVRFAGRLLLADGHKRLCAARDCGVRELPVEVWPWRRWWMDQAAQAAGHLRKTARILLLLPTRPRAAGALAATTVDHWRRVGRSLTSRARR